MSGYRTRLQFCIAALITNAVSYSFPPNANHIFNSIHSSMRQWGSSLNHNGMSFFLATVPEGTQLYHGDWLSDPVQGPEWLAFEAEHALVFTHPFPHNPPPGDGEPGGPGPGKPGPPPPPPLQDKSQQVMGKPTHAEAEDGYLHTYVAARDLRLLYVDGMSAGKTANGTMDTQDRILYQDKLKDDRGGMSNEREGAQLFCRMVQDRWNGRLDGLLRMEAGFEIILCDFSNLEVQQVTRVRPSGNKPGGDIGMHAGRMWLPAVASRYWNIGGDRVAPNYDHFVTAFDYGLDLFANGKNVHPRLEHIPADELVPMQQDLDALIINHDAGGPSANWQAVADMIVERYGTRLRFLVSGQASTLQQLQDEIEDIVTPFIDYDRRNASLEVERCSKQFVRSSVSTTTTAADAVLSVSRTVCGTLLEALSYTGYDSVVDHVQSLMNYLAWTTWKDCSGCGDHEICMIPMWPMGTVDDYNNPQCRDFSQPNGDGPRYWGPGRGPPPRKAKPAPCSLTLSG